jgi:hypothetical protein
VLSFREATTVRQARGQGAIGVRDSPPAGLLFLGPEIAMRLKQLAADTRDPLATVAFGILGLGGALGLIPQDIDPNKLAEIVGLLMAVLAGVFSYVHHKDFKRAIRESLEAAEDKGATPEPITSQDATPPEGMGSDVR